MKNDRRKEILKPILIYMIVFMLAVIALITNRDLEQWQVTGSVMTLIIGTIIMIAIGYKALKG